MNNYNATVECTSDLGGGHIKGKRYFVKNGCLEFEDGGYSSSFEDLSEINYFFTSKFKEVEDKQVAKKDLKTGMKVKLRNGEEYIVSKDSIEGDVLVNKSGWLSIPNYNEALSHKDFSNYDIVFVYVPKAVPYILDMDCKYWEQVWERESIKEITLDDVESKFGCKVKIVNKI